MPPSINPSTNAYGIAVTFALAGERKIVINARTKPIIAAGIIKPGRFQPKKAPAKHKDNRIAVLFTAPSKVIFPSIVDTLIF